MFTSSDSAEQSRPLGLAAQIRPRTLDRWWAGFDATVSESTSTQSSSQPPYGESGAAGHVARPSSGTNFLSYICFLVQYKNDVPVVQSVRHLVDKERDKLGAGAILSVYKGNWRGSHAAFKYIKRVNVPVCAHRSVLEDEGEYMKQKEKYDNAIKNIMFEIKIKASVSRTSSVRLRWMWINAFRYLYPSTVTLSVCWDSRGMKMITPKNMAWKSFILFLSRS